jgi:hypothetical protein
MSMFNTDEICNECKEKERQDPRYKDAVAADEAAIRSGNYNFRAESDGGNEPGPCGPRLPRR